MKKGECEGCEEKALLEKYEKREPGYLQPSGEVWLCDSCASVSTQVGLTDATRDLLMLKINHKLDRLLNRSR